MLCKVAAADYPELDPHPGLPYLPSWVNKTGQWLGRKLFGFDYDQTAPQLRKQTFNEVRPTMQERLEFLQRQRDKGGRWLTPAGMNSQAMFAGADKSLPSWEINDRGRMQRMVDQAETRRNAYRSIAESMPESDGYKSDSNKKARATALSKAEREEKMRKLFQDLVDEEREAAAARGRKIFFDNGGRWTPGF